MGCYESMGAYKDKDTKKVWILLLISTPWAPLLEKPEKMSIMKWVAGWGGGE